MNKKRIINVAIASVFSLGLVACTKDKVELNFEPVTLELGTHLDPAVLGITDLEGAVVTETDVNYSATGNYEAFVSYQDETYPFTITIVDTTAPEITPISEVPITVAPKQEITIEEIAKATDLNGITLIFKDAAYVTEKGTLCFEDEDKYEITIVATDDAGNTSEKTITIMVGTKPVFEGIKDISVTKGSSIDYKKGVSAKDNQGTDITDSIKINSSKVNLNKKGTYEVTYTVTDEFGLTATQTCKITVKDTEKNETSSNSSTDKNDSKPSSSKPSNSNSSNSNSSNSGSNNNGNSNNNSGNTGSQTKPEPPKEETTKPPTETKPEPPKEETTKPPVETKPEPPKEEKPEPPKESWGSFGGWTGVMTSSDKAACDSIAKAFFKGSIGIDSCHSQLMAYHNKYSEHSIGGIGIAGISSSKNTALLSKWNVIYVAEQTYTKGTKTKTLSIVF